MKRPQPYTLLTQALAPLVHWHLHRARRGVSPFFSKSNFFAAENPQKKLPQSPIWLHCASAGEVVAAQPLIETLLEQNRSIFITVWSANGALKLNQLFGEQVPWSWLPWDTPAETQRFIQWLNPSALWILETELWPNLMLSAAAAQVPITFVNGRVSEKTLRAPALLKHAWRRGLAQTTQILARSQQDAERFIQLGAPKARVEVAGNLKWLAAARLSQHPPQPLRTQPYVLFASAYEEETEALFNLLQEQHLKLPWVIVPRRPQEAHTMATQAQTRGFKPMLIQADQDAESPADILIETRFGNLTRWMAGARVVVMGGSFAPFGGHNFLEAAALAKPIIVGPDMRDFHAEIETFRQANAIKQYDRLEDAVTAITSLWQQTEKPIGLGARAFSCLKRHTEAVKTVYEQALGLNLPTPCHSSQYPDGQP